MHVIKYILKIKLKYEAVAGLLVMRQGIQPVFLDPGCMLETVGDKWRTFSMSLKYIIKHILTYMYIYNI